MTELNVIKILEDVRDDVSVMYGDVAGAFDEAIAKIKAWDYCKDSFCDTLRDFVSEGEALTKEAMEDIKSFDQVRHLRELNVKTKLLSEVLCFMKESLEKIKKGGE